MRKIDLEGAKNARDFGGIVNRENRTIKSGCFLRSNALDKLTEGDVDILTSQYKLSKVIDLRTDEEVDQSPDVEMNGVENIHVSLFEAGTVGITYDKESKKSLAMLKKLPNMKKLYAKMLIDEYSLSQIKKVFEMIIANEDNVMLWHCTAGKDRCGTISALFLAVLDVDRETIMEDYLLTNDFTKIMIEEYHDKIVEMVHNKMLVKKIESMFMVDKKFLNATFATIDKKWGSMDNFIEQGLGITKEMRDQFKGRYLV